MIIGKGAEATISKNKNKVIKERTKKNYRHPLLDEKLRKLRTRSESKILKKLTKVIPVPEIIEVDEKNKVIAMSYIEGKKLSDNLENLDYEKICKEIGESIAKLHDLGIIHGDLTTSNLIYNKKVYFIDFGLSFHSERIEDKAVDLHLIKQALEAKHPQIFEKAFETIIKSYNPKDKKNILERLKKVESRGRYKKGS